MAGITTLGTTYNLPNYTGILYQLTPSDTPFFSAIGGLTGAGRPTPSSSSGRATTCGRPGRTPAWRVPTPHRGGACPRERLQHRPDPPGDRGVSYTKLAATQAKAGINNAERNPVLNELDWQTEQMLKQMVRDIEYSFIQGTYQKPADNTTARQTRGILAAITTNVIAADAGGGAADALTEAYVLNLLQTVWENGGIQESETATLICNAFQKRQLTDIFITQKNYREESRNMAGVQVQTIETDFGRLNLMLNRHMPTDEVAVVSLEQCMPVYQEIPGKGHFFAEPLAKTGAKEKVQLYGRSA
ncbi:DUF5309 family protein [Streptomyces sp. C8S0]|uniref:SU10 major capsid protein n=1 Tax=Streptomyces sp. C8S0 TaxID=2585716 RepID=UPI001D058D48|nr:DUF5309 family protein [Streptomyces sp. C8S0]